MQDAFSLWEGHTGEVKTIFDVIEKNREVTNGES
jgi:hypothetical protein